MYKLRNVSIHLFNYSKHDISNSKQIKDKAQQRADEEEKSYLASSVLNRIHKYGKAVNKPENYVRKGSKPALFCRRKNYPHCSKNVKKDPQTGSNQHCQKKEHYLIRYIKKGFDIQKITADAMLSEKLAEKRKRRTPVLITVNNGPYIALNIHFSRINGKIVYVQILA